ncbi:MAG: hypothetical protein ACI30A_06855 [Paludibacteraceae bacterium]
MIVKLTEEQRRSERRRLLSNDVYVICHDVLKAKNPEYTCLTPAEIYLSAAEFVQALMKLPDMEEGIEDEADDLIHEASNENEAMLIMVVAAIQLRALTARKIGGDYMQAVRKLIERWINHPYLESLIGALDNKEQRRAADGKRIDLLRYELQAIEENGEGEEITQQIVDEFVEMSCDYDTTCMSNCKNVLEDINRKHGHIYDKAVEQLKKQIATKSSPKGEFVQNKYVENEIGTVGAGATGVSKIYGK